VASSRVEQSRAEQSNIGTAKKKKLKVSQCNNLEMSEISAVTSPLLATVELSRVEFHTLEWSKV